MINLVKAETAEEVRAILCDPELFGRIAEDGAEENIPFDGHQCYMMIMVDGKAVGVWILYPVNRSTLNLHCNILCQFRHYGKEAGKLILEWFIDEGPEQYQKLNAEIPVIYPEVYHFTKGFGFVDEGVNRQSIMKNGKLEDQIRLGITRDEIVKHLENM